jgi:glc operon protein GlcG
MDYEYAERLVAAARAAAAEAGHAVAIAVVDKGGHLVSFARMDGTGFLAVEVVIGKAYTAAAFGRPSHEMAAALDARPAFASQLLTLSHGRMTPVIGGLPVFVDGRLVGGIGVGGATGEQDLEVAEVALRREPRP